MSRDRHLVVRQVYEVSFASREAAERGSDLISRCQPAVERVIEATLEAVQKRHGSLRFERLDLDLGTLDEATLARDLPQRLRAVLHQTLAQSRPTEINHSPLDLLEHVLHHGLLPWWADPREPDHVERPLRALLVAPSVHTTARLRQILRHPDCARRCAAVLIDHPELLRDLLSHLDPAASPVIAPLTPQPSRSQAIAACALRLQTVATPHASDPEGLVQAVLKTPTPQTIARLARALTDPGAARRCAERLRDRPEDLAQLLATLTGQPLETIRQTLASVAAQAPGPQAVASHAAMLEVAASQRRTPAPSLSPTPDPLRQGVSVSAAGMVLLWPFLKPLLHRTACLTDEATGFRDELSHQRALQVLNFAATGQTWAAEYQLPLAKLLCGLDPNAVSIPPDPLDRDAQEEVIGLLEGLLQQFHTALGKLTVDGLRSSFLQRPGVLRSDYGGWLLTIERQTHDILLSRLPWSTRFIKLPWMPKPLQVDW